MSMSDPIADMLTRIRNGSRARFGKVDIPASRTKTEIARILKQEGYIKDFKVVTEDNKEILRVYLKFDAQNRGIIAGLKRVSKPSRRIYVASTKIPPVLNGFGISIISTSKGIFTDHEARKLNVGGEILCSVW
ncbi:MAG TPA: 30S ribosomal protein S8 [Thermodesulfobacteriota bacterium]|nr:30S ribosomal protein S8 [Deltaproteobacteria bacterium]HNR14894.1 30S ribosomal protein S8 [Thermodesulfobacteriota bacterium]HNU73119.1 30S ribosomal protein S8 [Thermodesulfobacteriota bacterium]HQO77044.1 30S ribosomal protein S8 [Thermodesulfobacteriota bacterium]